MSAVLRGSSRCSIAAVARLPRPGVATARAIAPARAEPASAWAARLPRARGAAAARSAAASGGAVPAERRRSDTCRTLTACGGPGERRGAPLAVVPAELLHGGLRLA